MSERSYVGPDFVVAGAPKCGTTTLYEALLRSPRVHLCPKEPHYFGRDLDFAEPRLSLAEYMALYLEAGPRIRGDISVWYMFSESAAQEIFDFNPNMKIVMLLRNPVDQMHSMHSQAVYNRDETVLGFQDALDLEASRRNGLNLPQYAHARHAVMYRSIATYSVQIDRFRSLFTDDQILYILLEDLQEDPDRVWGDLHAFLGVSTPPLDGLPTANANKTHRSVHLASAMAYGPRRWARQLRLDRLPRTWKDRAIRAHRGLVSLNVRYAPRSPMDPDLRAQLVSDFEGEIDQLEVRTVRDLSTWRA